MSSDQPSRGRGRGFKYDSQPRTVLVSKALSRLLRHAAVQERIPIDNNGYVRVDHLLGWQKLRSMKPPVTFDEVIEVVQDNEKKRFALKYIPKSGQEAAEGAAGPTPATIEGDQEPTTEAQTETETQRAIATYHSMTSNHDLTRFFIRATQGHSMKSVEAENLLTPISLDDPSSIPTTVVHGTFYGAWDGILASDGLKSMTRNHVHFATGPPLDEVLSSSSSSQAGGGDGDGGSKEKGKEKDSGKPKANLGSLLGKNKVISGMRSDAQILIYIDLRRALAEDKDMRWWRSENGVILTEGTTSSSAAEAAGGGEAKEGGGPDTGTGSRKTQKVVPTKYFLAAVDVKEGLGLIWKEGEGAVQELPERLRSRGVPRGKGGGAPRGRGRGRGGGQHGHGE